MSGSPTPPRRGALFAATAMLVLAAASASAQVPSFDCRAARLPDERRICANGQLAELDQLMNRGFLFLRAARGDAEARSIGTPLLNRRIACGGNDDCILQAQADAVRVYQSFGAPIELPLFAGGGSRSLDKGKPERPF